MKKQYFIYIPASGSVITELSERLIVIQGKLANARKIYPTAEIGHMTYENKKIIEQVPENAKFPRKRRR